MLVIYNSKGTRQGRHSVGFTIALTRFTRQRDVMQWSRGERPLQIIRSACVSLSEEVCDGTRRFATCSMTNFLRQRNTGGSYNGESYFRSAPVRTFRYNNLTSRI